MQLRRGTTKSFQRGLLTRLLSNAPANPRAATDVDAIVGHLWFMLNTRLGEAPIALDYGIEDLSDLATGFPRAKDTWRDSIRNTIETYEPRLTQVRVRLKPSTTPLHVSFEILARLTYDENQGPLTLQTEVDETGRFEVW